jgi:hypothetical protein
MLKAIYFKRFINTLIAQKLIFEKGQKSFKLIA